MSDQEERIKALQEEAKRTGQEFGEILVKRFERSESAIKDLADLTEKLARIVKENTNEITSLQSQIEKLEKRVSANSIHFARF